MLKATPTSSNRDESATKADCFLTGVTVLELGERVAAGACGKVLAELGATVIAIEPSSHTVSGKWINRANTMAGKRSMVVDPEKDSDRRLKQLLLQGVDVIILSSDLSHEDIDIWNMERPTPQILCDITAFGHTGPMSGEAASDAAIQAWSGVMDTTGLSEKPPAVTTSPVLEMSTAIYAGCAVLAALKVRLQTGFGQRIDMAIFDCAVNSLPNYLALHQAGRHVGRVGNNHPLHMPWGCFRTRDGRVQICAATDEHFSKISAAIGRPELAQDQRFHTNDARMRNRVELNDLLEAWSLGQTMSECEQVMSAIGIPCGAIVHVESLSTEPNLVHRRSLYESLDPTTGEYVRLARSPLRSEIEQSSDAKNIPAPNADREEIKNWLKLRNAEVQVATPVSGDPILRGRPLDGVRIIEIGHYTVAPLASRHLGALGADVVKIESPSGDATRRSSPMRADGQSYIFALSNTDKRGRVLDLRKRDDCDRLNQLLEDADILIENMKPGALSRFGFGAATLAKSHPHLITVSVNGFGGDSVYPGRPAFDTVIQAMSGLMSLTLVDDEPMKTGISASDTIGGQFGMLACLAGWIHRERFGSAVHFDISMQDTSVWITQSNWPPAARPSPFELLRASDGYVYVEAPAAQKCGFRETLRTFGETRASVIEQLTSAGINCAPVLSVREAFEHAQTAARQILLRSTSQEGEPWLVLNCPLGLLSTPPRVRSVMGRLAAGNPEDDPTQPSTSTDTHIGASTYHA
ncbi:lipid metabolism-like protein [Caballeronia calidae]|uniref:Lipid metabolism-like protein n=1 Tax=Caballeronia calidae TaxID=1777139 RepID=A0A158E4I3_9BURK|nr:CoA transferase [Caballeronia calidae]SAL01714.1 lipid metabolism-like protein [Caballeronia calidae]